MNHEILEITMEPFAEGEERFCYLHPNDAQKVVKIQKGESRKQTLRELKFYGKLSQRKMTDYRHIPRYYGKVKTNLGEGFVVGLISDFDGKISRTIMEYFQQGFPLSDFLPYIEELEQNLLENRLIISADLVGRHNMVVQRLSAGQPRLVIVDGLGNHSALNWFDGIAMVAKSKIRRRWERVFSHLKTYSDQALNLQRLNPKTIEGADRRLE
ncbi:MAG: YrbL family protein [Planctomycetota bacterium]|jgi:hypothetical protein